VFRERWPAYDPAKLREDQVTLALQVNGKLRDSIQIPAGASRETALATAKKALEKRLVDVEIVKEIYVPEKIINFVTKNR
jgi:leucyl-tRNA synthetase